MNVGAAPEVAGEIDDEEGDRRGAVPVATHSAWIDADPEQVMTVVTDFEAYPDFLPEMQKANIVKSEGPVWEVDFIIKIIRKMNYTLRLEKEAPDRLTWGLVKGSFRSNDGSWKLAAEGGGTRAEYSIDLQIGHFVPGNIVRSLVDRTLPETVSRFKEEVERRYPRGSPSSDSK